MSEKSSNENGHNLSRISGNQKRLFIKAFSIDDFSVITGPKITIIYI